MLSVQSQLVGIFSPVNHKGLLQGYFVQNISDVAVTIKIDQGHQNWNEDSTFTGDYPMAQFEKSRA